jgi:hypothetical protein
VRTSRSRRIYIESRPLSPRWSLFLKVGLSVLALALLAGCGSGGGSGGTSLTDVATCLEGAGYGVTVVPTSEIGSGGAESRGPGQSGELLIARQDVKPAVGSDNADAVVAFWKSAKLAASSPNAQAKGLGTHADSIGAITVQATTHLVLYALKAARTSSGRRAALQAQVKKIEGCVG